MVCSPSAACCVTSISRAAGPSAHGSGTRPPTRGHFSPTLANAVRETWCGSVIGATKSAVPNSMSFWCSPSLRSSCARACSVCVIRPCRALACKRPLVSAPWRDDEGLFTAGEDFLVARDGAEMRRHLRTLINDRDRAEELAAHGHRTVMQRHTCAHRVDELATICRDIGLAINDNTYRDDHHNDEQTQHRLLRL